MGRESKVTMSERLGLIENKLDALAQSMERGFTAVDHRFVGVDHRFEAVDQRFDAIDQRFEAVDQRFDAIDGRFEAADPRIDQFEARSTIQVESLRDDIQRMGEGYGATLDGIGRALEEIRESLTTKVSDHDRAPENQASRLNAFEKR